MSARQLNSRVDKPTGTALAKLPLRSVLAAFSAGKAVPGSGSANALHASIAAALVASVARKTRSSENLRYISVHGMMDIIVMKADRARIRLLELVDLDAAAFGPVVGIRRDTGRMSDRILQDDSLRKEIASLRPATEIPLEVAERSIEVAELATKLFDVGFEPARGESFSAQAAAIAAAESSVVVAQINTKTVRTRVARLHDPELEADWLERMRIRNRDLRRRIATLKRERARIAQELDQRTAAAPPATRRRTSGMSLPAK